MSTNWQNFNSANSIKNIPAGSLAAHDVQAAINELDTEKQSVAGLGDYTKTLAVADVVTKGPWVDVRAFGAVGDGVADDTVAITDALLSGRKVFDGFGLPFVVTNLLIPSNVTLQNFNFITKTGATDFITPITIDGQLSAKENITLKNVTVNGNRQNQTLIVAASEDGGRHGFKITGKCSNITLVNCKGTYCGTDGLAIFSGDSRNTADDSDFCFSNIKILDCDFSYNRRMGISGDSIDGIHIINTDMNENGKDLNTTDELTHGNRGSRAGDVLYGRPFDFEGYGVGCCNRNIFIDNCDCTNNVQGALFSDFAAPGDTGFLMRSNVFISNCLFDQGLYTNTSYPLTFYANTLTVPNYTNVSIINCQFSGTPWFHCVDKLNASGGFVYNPHYNNSKAAITYCTNWYFSVPSTKNFITVALPFTITPAAVLGTITFGAVTTTLVSCTNDSYKVSVSMTATPAAIANGYQMKFSVNNGYVIRAAQFYLVTSATGQFETCNTSPNYTADCIAAFNATADTSHECSAILEIAFP